MRCSFLCALCVASSAFCFWAAVRCSSRSDAVQARQGTLAAKAADSGWCRHPRLWSRLQPAQVAHEVLVDAERYYRQHAGLSSVEAWMLPPRDAPEGLLAARVRRRRAVFFQAHCIACSPSPAPEAEDKRGAAFEFNGCECVPALAPEHRGHAGTVARAVLAAP